MTEQHNAVRLLFLKTLLVSPRFRAQVLNRPPSWRRVILAIGAIMGVSLIATVAVGVLLVHDVPDFFIFRLTPGALPCLFSALALRSWPRFLCVLALSTLLAIGVIVAGLLLKLLGSSQRKEQGLCFSVLVLVVVANPGFTWWPLFQKGLTAMIDPQE